MNKIIYLWLFMRRSCDYLFSVGQIFCIEKNKVDIVFDEKAKNLEKVVYAILSDSKPIYVGKTELLVDRFSLHKTMINKNLNNKNVNTIKKIYKNNVKEKKFDEYSKIHEYLAKIFKSGKEANIDIVILDEAETAEELNKKEVHFIDKHKTLFPFGCNRTKGGGACARDPKRFKSFQIPEGNKSKEFYSPKKTYPLIKKGNNLLSFSIPKEEGKVSNLVYRIKKEATQTSPVKVLYGVTGMTLQERSGGYNYTINHSNDDFFKSLRNDSEKCDIGIVYKVPEEENEEKEFDSRDFENYFIEEAKEVFPERLIMNKTTGRNGQYSVKRKLEYKE